MLALIAPPAVSNGVRVCSGLAKSRASIWHLPSFLPHPAWYLSQTFGRPPSWIVTGGAEAVPPFLSGHIDHVSTDLSSCEPEVIGYSCARLSRRCSRCLWRCTRYLCGVGRQKDARLGRRIRVCGVVLEVRPRRSF
jgi:hypothetical protein